MPNYIEKYFKNHKDETLVPPEKIQDGTVETTENIFNDSLAMKEMLQGSSFTDYLIEHEQNIDKEMQEAENFLQKIKDEERDVIAATKDFCNLSLQLSGVEDSIKNLEKRLENIPKEDIQSITTIQQMIEKNKERFERLDEKLYKEIEKVGWDNIQKNLTKSTELRKRRVPLEMALHPEDPSLN